MRIRVAAMAMATLVVTGVSSVSWAGDDSAALVSDGWQQLKGSDTPLTAAAAASASPASAVTAAPGKPAEPTQPAPKPTPVWTIRAGYPIGQELKHWGTPIGWNVVWQMPRDVVAASTASFTGDFPTAVTEVVKTLADNGALIHAQIYDGNRTVVIEGPGVTPQQ
ncbi:hypothetical protein A8H39_00925 [Paraburkholderia fungorum]|uniref:TcpQ domain-containing protein n=1 Tax=Paraburkholderia fungorum TaxID=134537 RepID=UPI000488EE63|nr:TcpQ domain-containing protein [Paraburkholderia fungorum]PNE59743.1 hypothetical protein A8H39_00925 [Paraburkholderia fungorum]